jgi:Na+/H+-dicarboxylate symporters
MIKILKNTTFQLIAALILGVIFGGVMKLLPSWMYIDDIIVNGFFKLLGNGFIELVKMTVMPLVFVSLVCGVSSFGDTKKLGSVGIKTLLMFFVTTLIAIIIAISLALIFKPGVGLNMNLVSQDVQYIPKQAKSIIDIMLDIIPSNPIKAMSKGNLLQVLVFALFFGVALGNIGKEAEPLVKIFSIINDCIMKIVSMIMAITPIGVFALISNTVYSIGFESLLGILKMSAVVVLALGVQSFVVYGGIYKLTTGFSFKEFLKNYTKIAGIAFSTSSSNAALPFSMEMMEKMGVSKAIYRFVLPIGATINMAGTAIMQGISAVFIAQAYGLNLPLQSMITITITAILASVGAAGVPGVGMIMMTMVLESVGLPVEGIALIIGIDRLLDMIRTVVNVMGDCICAVVVAKSENDINVRI